jgi:hypothetical protein
MCWRGNQQLGMCKVVVVYNESTFVLDSLITISSRIMVCFASCLHHSSDVKSPAGNAFRTQLRRIADHD